MQVDIIDFRSDTVTLPTPEMKRAIGEAKLGDDVYKEDPTVNRLEEFACEIFDREAALFFPTGTMANQAAVMTHTHRGDEIILEQDSHIYQYEVGGLAILASVQPKLIPSVQGALSPDSIEEAIRRDNIHFPPTGLVCLENTHNLHGGTVLSRENIEEVRKMCKKNNLPLHMDGARIFNAAKALNIPVRELVKSCDTIMFCLSKGLAAPAGSMLLGDEDFIERARKCRKLLGGGMRQAGILAAAGIVALKDMPSRLHEDHENAKVLAEGLAKIKGIEIDLESVQTNIVRFRLKQDTVNKRISVPELVEALEKEKIKIQPTGGNGLRMVTHKDITSKDVHKALAKLKDYLDSVS